MERRIFRQGEEDKVHEAGLNGRVILVPNLKPKIAVFSPDSDEFQPGAFEIVNVYLELFPEEIEHLNSLSTHEEKLAYANQIAAREVHRISRVIGADYVKTYPDGTDTGMPWILQ